MTLRYVTLVFMDRGVEVHKFSYKERGQYPAFFYRASLVNKGFIADMAVGEIYLAGHSGQCRAGKIALSVKQRPSKSD